MRNERQRGLGRGLGALIPTDVPRESLAGQSVEPGRPADLFFAGSRGDSSDVRPSSRVSPDTRSEDAAPASSPVSLSRRETMGSAFDKAFEGLGRRDEQGGREGQSRSGRSTNPPPTAVHSDAAGSGDSPSATLRAVPGLALATIPLGDIRPNAQQPRTAFDEQGLDELAASIKEIGVLQPVVVRRTEGEETPYELIMGERRFRASRQAGLASVPAIVKSTPDDAMLRDALLENLHRAQLNPLEEAAAYEQLLQDFGCTHDELAAKLARSRPQISNTLRLLRLPPPVARRVAAGVLTAGHARALLGLSDAASMERLAQRAVAEGLSVRSVEEVVAAANPATPPSVSPRVRRSTPELDDIAAALTERLDTRVSINVGKTKGKLTVEFANRDDLDRLIVEIGGCSAVGDNPEADGG